MSKIEDGIQPTFCFQRQYEATHYFDSFKRLKQIKARTLIIAGGDDVLVPPENSHILASRIPISELVIFENGGHVLHLESSEKFNATTYEFLKALKH